MRSRSSSWYVYLARCADGSLYCGIARDVAKRIAEHDAGRGARYTRGRGPLAVVLVRRYRTKGMALRVEYAIKQLARTGKERLITSPHELRRLIRRMTGAARPTRRVSRDGRAGMTVG
ncbi:MAG: GIY-YIG nuclease family protein [Kofleriaceae bacterium]